MFCKLTPAETERMHQLLRGVADDPHAMEMHRFIQHGTVTTYEHCLRVARIAYWLNLRLHCRAREASLLWGRFCTTFTCTTGTAATTSPGGTGSSIR